MQHCPYDKKLCRLYASPAAFPHVYNDTPEAIKRFFKKRIPNLATIKGIRNFFKGMHPDHHVTTDASKAIVALTKKLSKDQIFSYPFHMKVTKILESGYKLARKRGGRSVTLDDISKHKSVSKRKSLKRKSKSLKRKSLKRKSLKRKSVKHKSFKRK